MPSIGIPTATSFHQAHLNCETGVSPMIVYDHMGIHPKWQAHLDWLSHHIKTVRCVKSNEAAWNLASWT